MACLRVNAPARDPDNNWSEKGALAMSHNCKCECKHENVKYCQKCDKVYCLDCSKEWPEQQWEYPYQWYYTTPHCDTGTPQITWANGTTTAGITNSETLDSIQRARKEMQSGAAYLSYNDVFGEN